MLECDLKKFKCPQQFVQFKLALRNAQSSNKAITFSINNDESADDITRFLSKSTLSVKNFLRKLNHLSDSSLDETELRKYYPSQMHKETQCHDYMLHIDPLNLQPACDMNV